MSPSRAARRPRPEVPARLGGALLSIAVAVALYTRFDIDGSLSRDEGIYAYGGQQMADGVPPYASVFDAKAPLATMIAGAAVQLARLVHSNDLYAIRAAFFACALVTVLAVYLLAARLFDSTLAGLTAAVVFSANWPFAVDALAGPDAKTPAVMFAVVSMWLLCRRQWFLGAFAGGLAFLVWQPMLFYPFVAVAAAVATTSHRRWRAGAVALTGAGIPVLLTTAYFALAGALQEFIEATLVFPLTGVTHAEETVGHRVARIADVVNTYYGLGGWPFWAGLALLALAVVAHLVRHRRTLLAALGAPVVSVVLVTGLLVAAYAATDFQSYPDLYPFLPYPALGFAGAVAAVAAAVRPAAVRFGAGVAVVAALAVLTSVSFVSFADDPANDHGLRRQLSSACAVHRAQVPGAPVWSFGNPAVLVLTHRTNPDRFVYLTSGADQWKLAHTTGGFDAWTRQIQQVGPSVVVINGWTGRVRRQLAAWLRENGYRSRFAGKWHVFVTPAARARAARKAVRLTRGPTDFATGPGGRALPGWTCA